MREHERPVESIFGTDGIRAKVGEYPLTDEMILKIGRAVGNFVKSNLSEGGRRGTITIAKDTRCSGEKIEDLLIDGIISQDVDVVKLGILPTPASAFLVKRLKADLSVVISASHNSIIDNGLKFFTKQGYKFSSHEEAVIDALIAADNGRVIDISNRGEIREETRAVSLYISFLKKVVKGIDLSQFKVVADCGYGSACSIIRPLAEAVGLNIICVNDTPDGMNINQDAGSLHPEILSEKVIFESADCGFAFDGDGDRLILSDEKGNILDGDFILAIIGRYLNKKNKLNRSSIVTTYMSNIGLDMSVDLWAGKVIKVDVGDKYVLEKMTRSRLNLGGEQSGHIILLDYSTTGDALIAALFLLKIMAEEKKTLKELSRCMYKFPQVLVNLDVNKKLPFEEMPKFSKAIKRYESKLGSNGRVYVRYSGTENKLRIMIEGQNHQTIKEFADELAVIAMEEFSADYRGLLCQS